MKIKKLLFMILFAFIFIVSCSSLKTTDDNNGQIDNEEEIDSEKEGHKVTKNNKSIVEITLGVRDDNYLSHYSFYDDASGEHTYKEKILENNELDDYTKKLLQEKSLRLFSAGEVPFDIVSEAVELISNEDITVTLFNYDLSELCIQNPNIGYIDFENCYMGDFVAENVQNIVLNHSKGLLWEDLDKNYKNLKRLVIGSMIPYEKGDEIPYELFPESMQCFIKHPTLRKLVISIYPSVLELSSCHHGGYTWTKDSLEEYELMMNYIPFEGEEILEFLDNSNHGIDIRVTYKDEIPYPYNLMLEEGE